MDIKQWFFAGLGIGAWYFLPRLFNQRKRSLLKNGVSTVCKIISIKKTMVYFGSVGYQRPQYEIVLEGENIGAFNKPVTIKHAFPFGDIIPKAGDRIYILVDPVNPDNMMVSPNNTVE